MELTVLFAKQRRVPAIIMTTLWLSHGSVFILSKIESLTRMNFMTKGSWKVLIRYNSILVYIEGLEQLAKLLLTHFETPVINVKSKLTFRNSINLSVFIEVSKSLQNGFPLCFNFVNHNSLKCLDSLRLLSFFKIFSFFINFV